MCRVVCLRRAAQLSDCHRGVVFDGLDATYCHSAASALRILLRAFDNRRFIYVVNLVHTYQDFQAREKATREAEGKQGGEGSSSRRVEIQGERKRMENRAMGGGTQRKGSYMVRSRISV